ncbi:hypothetical protein JCM10908_002819 [Rhodotorula pacifica]|uniref:mitogen-activated protein kinase kinase kinase BCK1 n=1 Tax=Rhodotorula pacifica TaxID=1495444 RepID=UPI003172EFE5
MQRQAESASDMRSASEGYAQRYPGDLPPRHAGLAGVGTVRPLPTPRPSQPAYPHEQGGRFAQGGFSHPPAQSAGGSYAPTYGSMGGPRFAATDDNSWSSSNPIAGAGGIRHVSGRPPPSDQFRYPDTASRSPVPRGSLSPRPSAHPDESSSYSQFHHSFGSPPLQQQTSFSPQPPRSPLPPSAIVTATADLESLVVVPLNNLSSVEAVKDVVMTRLHIADEDMPRHAFYLTRIGAGEGRPVTDDELWTAVKACASGDGPQLTVFVKEVRSPRPGHWSPQDGRSAAEFASAATYDRVRSAHHRDRETSRSSGSNGRAPSPNSAASFHRDKSPSVSSRASEPPSVLAPRETARSPAYEDATLANRRQQLGSTVAVPPRQASSSSFASQRLTTSPQSASTVLSPSGDLRFGSGHPPQSSTSTTPKTSPEEYFQYPSATQPVTSPAASASLSPSLPGPQGYHPASSSSVFGGPTRRLPPAPLPDMRTQTVPVLQVTSTDWSRSIPASTFHHATSLPAASSYSQHPPRAVPSTDPRYNMRQYASDPYRNLPLPSNQSPYHNLSLQGQSSVVHLQQQPRPGYSNNNLPPRATTLAAPTAAGLSISRSADNLRGTYESAAFEQPGQGPTPTARVTAHPVARLPADASSSGTSGSNLASAFYSAPVQAQHQQQFGSIHSSRILPQALSPHSARADWPNVLDRPSTATGFMSEGDRVRSRQDSTSSSNGGRSRSGTVNELERRFDSQLSLLKDSEERSPAVREPSAPTFADDDGAYDGLVDISRAPHHPTLEALANTSYPTTSPPSSTRSSLTGPITPASDVSRNRFSLTPAVAEKPRLVDEFGDPLDEETGTWFPVNQPAPSPVPTPTPDRKPSQPSTLSGTSTSAVSVPTAYGPVSPSKVQPSPMTPASKPADRQASVPDAQDWTQTILSRFGASSTTEGGTLLPAAGAGTLRPEGTTPPAAASAPNTPRVVDEFGDELDDGATFFPGHGPAQQRAVSTTGPSSPNLDEKESALSSRPSLRLKIGSTAGPQSGPQSQQSGRDSDRSAGRGSAGSEHESARREGPPTAGRKSDGSASSTRRFLSSRFDRSAGDSDSPFARRNSLAARASDDNDWAFRPPVETVLEHLDVFFPEHDLDKPVFDLPAPSPPSGSTGASSPAKDQPLAAQTRRSNLGYHKSIRVVAQDRKRMLQKAGRNVATAASGLASNLLRRRSTKLFGAKIEEVTSAQMKDIDALRETSDDDPENFSYKWIKGDLIGRGTYGHVYIALSVTTGETIAVKQVEMPRSFSDKEDQRIKGMISSLKAEIELLKDLDHPNIVLYLGMEQTPDFLSIFLEYVPGGSIGRIIRTHGKFEEDVIRFFTLQILDGLEYLHSLGILHRDMKADNILIDQDGMCKISDFGTSKKSGDIYQNNENMSMQGSIFWMAPEVIHNNKQGYSAKADIWSLGCICIEMLAGSRPWEGEGFMGAMFKLGAERMRPPLPPDVKLSHDADRFVSDCLQIEPEARPKASEAKLHPFLISLDPNWSFDQTSLYRIMTQEEQRRRLPINSHSATHA